MIFFWVISVVARDPLPLGISQQTTNVRGSSSVLAVNHIEHMIQLQFDDESDDLEWACDFPSNSMRMQTGGPTKHWFSLIDSSPGAW